MDYLFHLNEGLALLRDPLQYIIARPARRQTAGKGGWNHVFYTRFGSESLLKFLAWRGVTLSPETVALITVQLPSDAEVLAGERRLRHDPDNAPDPRALRREAAQALPVS
jgi:hypothetical protein